MPLLIHPDWLGIRLARGSILHDTRLIYDGVVSKTVLRVTYSAVICLPLLASTAPGVRAFGMLVLGSVLLAFLVHAYAFTSIWCYLAAVVSGFIAVPVVHLPHRAGGRVVRA